MSAAAWAWPAIGRSKTGAPSCPSEHSRGAARSPAAPSRGVTSGESWRLKEARGRGGQHPTIVASRLLQPLLNQLPENSSTWWDARKIVDRLAFDARELLEFVRLVDPTRASDVLRASE